MKGGTFSVGDAVRWKSSQTRREGVIEAVIPSGKHPHEAGYLELGKNSMHRDHETYAVRGGVQGQRTTLYWPMVSLLERAEGLTAEEVRWCHANAPAVRKLMAG